MREMPRSFIVISIAAASLALAVAGCGSGSDSTSTSGTTSANGQTTAPAGSETTTAKKPSRGSGGQTEGKQAPSRGTGEEFGKNDPYSAPKGGDNSIQTYGSEASRAEETAVTSAMFAFFRALAAKDYAKVCKSISEKTRKGIEQFAKLQHKEASCPTLLEALIGASPGGAKEAKKAAEGTVGHVRVGESNAFVLFTPAGGKPSYFVMTKENGEWKPTGLNAGAPLNP